MEKLLYENLAYKIIGTAQEVYKELGPGYFAFLVSILSKNISVKLRGKMFC